MSCSAQPQFRLEGVVEVPEVSMAMGSTFPVAFIECNVVGPFASHTLRFIELTSQVVAPRPPNRGIL